MRKSNGIVVLNILPTTSESHKGKDLSPHVLKLTERYCYSIFKKFKQIISKLINNFLRKR